MCRFEVFEAKCGRNVLTNAAFSGVRPGRNVTLILRYVADFGAAALHRNSGASGGSFGHSGILLAVIMSGLASLDYAVVSLAYSVHFGCLCCSPAEY